MQFNPLAIFSNKNDGKQLTQYLAVISGKFTSFQKVCKLKVVIPATITLFTTGIYQGWGSPSLVKILSDEYPIEVTEDEASYITIIGALGHVTAGFLASQLSDRIGRKSTIIGIAIPQVCHSNVTTLNVTVTVVKHIVSDSVLCPNLHVKSQQNSIVRC